jgi:hypothetical protein
LEKKNAISISLSVSSHRKTGKQFNPMKITFILFPAKEEFPQSLANSHLFPGSRTLIQNLYEFAQTPDGCF